MSGVAVGAGQLWPVLIAATEAVAAETALTGALHLDGLADCADGLAGQDREHRLRIMKDHVIGAYAASRGAMLPLARFLPDARTEGMGRGVVQELSTRQTVTGLRLALLGLVAAGVTVGAWTALLMALVATLITLTIGLTAHLRIGGVTGDVRGACAELTLVSTLLAGTTGQRSTALLPGPESSDGPTPGR